MKKYDLIVFSALLMLVSCQEQLTVVDDISSTPVTKSVNTDDVFLADSLKNSTADTVRISKWDAMKIVEPITSKYPDRWVDISNEIIPAGTRIAYNETGHFMDIDDLSYYDSPDFDSWLLVIESDLSIMGLQSQTHIFVNTSTGEFTTIDLDGRAIVEWDTSRYVFEDSPKDIEKPTTDSNALPVRGFTHAKYAVIISGGTNMYNNTSCFYEDSKYMYNVLVYTLRFPKNNIFVLMSDGGDPAYDQRNDINSFVDSSTDLDEDYVSETIHEANKSELASVFSTLESLVNPGDEVLVFMTDTGHSYGAFNLWGGEVLYPLELNSLLDNLGSSVKIDVVLGQSYSGAFISAISGTNRTIATSCSSSETAHRDAFSHTYFLKEWTDAIITYADVSTTDIYNDAFAAPSELFLSADNYLQSLFSENPQYSSTPSNFGERHSIDGAIIPYLTGNDYLSTTVNNVFTLHDSPPSPYLYAWQVGDNASIVSNTDSTVTVKGDFSGTQYYKSSTTVTASLIIDGYMHKITKPIDSVWKPGSYIGNNYITGGNGIYSITTHPGAYGYYWQCMNPDWQIISQNGNYALVTEGYTVDPVYFVVSFNEPQGGTITLVDQVH